MRRTISGAMAVALMLAGAAAFAQGFGSGAVPGPVERRELPPVAAPGPDQPPTAGGPPQPGPRPIRPDGASRPAPADPYGAPMLPPITGPAHGPSPSWNARAGGDPWQGLSAAHLGELVQSAPLPSSSPWLQKAFRRLFETESAGESADFTAARRAGLRRAGLSAPEPPADLAAAERGAKYTAVAGAALAEMYRAQRFEQAEIAAVLGATPGPRQRALLFQAMTAATDPMEKLKLLRDLTVSAAKAGLKAAMAEAARQELGKVAPRPELLAFADMAIPSAILAGDGATARAWIAVAEQAPKSRDAALRWRVLSEVAGLGEPGEAAATLQSATALALVGGLTSEMLHRLVTVLDALDYSVPIPLWEAASRTAQPTGGYLPPTGLLSLLSEAAKAEEAGRALLLASSGFGPDGPAGANLLALGDGVRALKAVGLEAAARGAAFEALAALMPAPAKQG